MTKTILHISNDYPDILAPNKTKAVSNLVDGTPEYRHVVYSLNRVSAWNGLAHLSFGEDRTAIAYGALPKGLFWERRLRAVAQWILADLKAKNIAPDLIEAHKFTIEGLIGQDLAKAFNVPLICDVQGYTDINILKKKQSLRGRYKQIARECAAILPYAPWPLKAFEDLIGLDRAKATCLPVVPYVDEMSAAPIIEDDKLLSVFHLDGWQNKNFENMVQAVKALSIKRKNITLDVYGSGAPKTLLTLQGVIEKADAASCVRLMGPVDHGDMQGVMKKYAAFVMPSKSESYGLVYVEALFSGVPVMFNANRGISGYYDPKDIGYGADPHDVNDIMTGMEHLLDHQKSLKDNVEKMQKNGDFEQLRKENILNTYRGVIEGALKGRT